MEAVLLTGSEPRELIPCCHPDVEGTTRQRYYSHHVIP